MSVVAAVVKVGSKSPGVGYTPVAVDGRYMYSSSAWSSLCTHLALLNPEHLVWHSRFNHRSHL